MFPAVVSGRLPIIRGLVSERCTCGAEVLTAVGLASTWLVDAVEVFPQGTCHVCHGTGEVMRERELDATYRLASERPRRHTVIKELVPCRRCAGAGLVGEVPQRGMILVNEFFMARQWFGQERLRGEAFHREHVCVETDGACAGDAPSVDDQMAVAA